MGLGLASLQLFFVGFWIGYGVWKYTFESLLSMKEYELLWVGVWWKREMHQSGYIPFFACKKLVHMKGLFNFLGKAVSFSIVI